MSIRFNVKAQRRFNVSGLRSGYGDNFYSGLTIPSVGIEDVDVALFGLFDKEIPFQVGKDNDIKKVPVLFASGEKWALLKKRRALRDRNGTLILPLITIVRTSFKQDPASDIAGRGINQQTGEIVIKRRLDRSDRSYQNIINRMLLRHQQNLSVPSDIADDGQVSTSRVIGALSNDPTVGDGGLLFSDRRDNVYEVIVLPSPQFYTVSYDVTLWTQYMQHMNQLNEQLIASFLPQGNAWRLDTPKGYWFVASVDGNSYNLDNNFEDMSSEERTVRLRFTVNVPAYILATDVPGAPVPVRRYVSAPIVTFGVGLGDGLSDDSAECFGDDPFLGADDPTLPLDSDRNNNRDQRQTNATRLYPSPRGSTNPDDPALMMLPRAKPSAKYKKIVSIDKNGKQVTNYARIKSTNRFTGETVLAPGADLGGLTIVIVGD